MKALKIILWSVASLVMLTYLFGEHPTSKEEGASYSPPHQLSFSVRVRTIGALQSLIFTSIVDSVEVNSVMVNRGNCEPNQPSKFPRKMKFGDHFEYGFFYPCRPIEVTINTSDGLDTFHIEP